MEEQKKTVIRVLNQDAKEKKPFEHTIAFDFKSEIDGKDYTGTFTYRKMRLADYAKVASVRARLNGGLPEEVIDPPTANINNQIAHCAVWFSGNDTLPEWAKDLSQLYDSEIVAALFKEGISFEGSFRKSVG